MANARHELKYFISVADAPILISRLERALVPDANGDRFGEYTVRSLYFDDAFDSAYNDKIDGVSARDKYRIRIYKMSDEAIFLERKRKKGERIEKTGARITRKLAEQLIEGNAWGLEKVGHPLLQDLFVQMRLKQLRPKVLVDYDRAAYLHPAEHVRITFDKRVRTAGQSIDLFNPGLSTFEVLDPGKMVLEVKYDEHLPGYISPLISAIPAERSAISKYVLCRRYAP